MPAADDTPLPYLNVGHVEKHYGAGDARQAVLRGVSFCMDRGERVALLGQSGCGKSTLLNVLSGIDQIDNGEIVIAGQVISALSENDRTLFRRKHIGFIYQSFNLIQTLTVLENVKLPLQLNGFEIGEVQQRAANMLERVGLAGRISAFPDQLSGGEQQRVAIARAMVHNPALVLADEHTGNLDAATGRQMIELFNEIAASTGQTVLMVTHSRSVAATADRTVQLVNGEVVNNTDDSLAW